MLTSRTTMHISSPSSFSARALNLIFWRLLIETTLPLPALTQWPQIPTTDCMLGGGRYRCRRKRKRGSCPFPQHTFLFWYLSRFFDEFEFNRISPSRANIHQSGSIVWQQVGVTSLDRLQTLNDSVTSMTVESLWVVLPDMPLPVKIVAVGVLVDRREGILQVFRGGHGWSGVEERSWGDVCGGY